MIFIKSNVSKSYIIYKDLQSYFWIPNKTVSFIGANSLYWLDILAFALLIDFSLLIVINFIEIESKILNVFLSFKIRMGISWLEEFLLKLDNH